MGFPGKIRVLTDSSPFFNNVRSPSYWILLIGIPALLALAAALLVSFSAPMPIYLLDARQYVSTGSITDTTFPLEFAWLAGLSIRALGSRGPEVLQAVFYLLTVLSVWALARKCGATARHALIAALVAALYPQLPDSVTKVWDVELAVLLMVLLMLLTVCLMRDGLRPFLVLAMGVVFGLSLAQRPNMLMLLPLPAWFCFAAAAKWPRKLLAFVFAGALAVLTFVAVNTLAHGSFFLPQNGPYNLVQGHNEHSIQAMLHDLTCEPSVALFMKADGMNPDGFNEADPKLQHYFTHRALTYMRSHPLQEVEITAVKFWTIFRPNTRIHHEMDPMTALILCMSLIFPAWVVLLRRRATRTGLDALDWTFIAAVALYVLPFLLTSSDPRYQIPLEICLLAHIACMGNQPRRPAASSQAL
jgi:hypothetical protein